MGIGAGFANLTLKPDAGGDDIDFTGAGPSVELAFGGTVAPGLVLGGGIYGTSIASPTYSQGNLEEDGGAAVASMVGPFIDYYFDPNGGFHLEAALGYTALSAEEGDVYPLESASGGGFGLVAGVGYEWWVGEQWGLGVLGRLHYVSGTVTGDDSDEDTDVSGTIISVLLTGTLH